MTGGATFNEVFLTDARVPHANVIGEVHRGWGVAVTTLAHERNSLGASGGGGEGGAMIGRNDLDRPAGQRSRGGGDMAGMAMAFGGGGSMIKQLPALVGRADDRILRDKVMRIYTLMEIARFTSLRVQAAKAAGRGPGPEVSTGKLAASEMVRQLRDVGLEALGPHGQLMGDDTPMGGMLQQLALFSPAISIAGGSDQIQRNIIGERVLGLPGEPRVDKDVPFAALKVGTQR
jgi:alkylation response protein AidB-like acyl-CoA dehydrogenase